MRTLVGYMRAVELLEEDKSSQSNPEAPKGALFGQFAFAPTRPDTPTPKEPNTPEEEKVRAAIADYIENNEKGALNSVAKDVMQLQQMGYYQKVLDPNEYGTVYRFINLPKDEMAKVLGMPPRNMKPYGTTGGGTISPHDGLISGWTTNLRLFSDDEFDGYGQGNAIAIFAAPVQGNKFFGNPGTLATAVGLPNMSNEMETIAVGPVRYTKCSYAILDLDDMLDSELFSIKIKRVIRNLRG